MFERPIGFNSVVSHVEEICTNASIYKYTSMRPPHLIIQLDKGEGRTTLVEYITRMYKKFNVIDFDTEPDDYIEIVLDGSLQQFRKSFITINSAAVYENDYSNIISLDITALAGHLNEVQFSEFLSKIKRCSEHAMLIFFFEHELTPNQTRIIEKLRKTISDIQQFTVAPYSYNELSRILMRIIEEKGIEIIQDDDVAVLIADGLKRRNFTSIKQSVALMDDIMKLVLFPKASEPLLCLYGDWKTIASPAKVRRIINEK